MAKLFEIIEATETKDGARILHEAKTVGRRFDSEVKLEYCDMRINEYRELLPVTIGTQNGRPSKRWYEIHRIA